MSLKDLVAPLAPERFAREVWERRACLLRSTGRSWDHLGVTEASLLDAINQQRVAARIVRTEADDDVTEPAPTPLALPIPRDATLCVGHVDRAFPAVASLVRSVLNGLGLAGEGFTNLYYSAEEHGFAGHFDTQAVFVVQLAGHKLWRFGARPAVPWPPNGCTDAPAPMAEFRAAYPTVPLPSPGRLEEAILAPGDVLFLPAGTWHRARAVGGTSLALAVTILPCTAWQIVATALEPRLQADDAWRRDVGAPLDVPPERLPDSVLQHLCERIDALRRQLGELTPAELHLAWRRRRGRPARQPWGGAPLLPSTRLAHGSGLAPGYQLDGEALSLLHGGCAVELDASAERFVRALALTPRFTADAAVDWDPDLSWDDVAPMLEALLAEGVLEVDTEPPT